MTPLKSATRFYASMLIFISGFIGLVYSANLFVFYLCWELVGNCSFSLAGSWYTNREAAAGARKVLLMTHIAGYGLTQRSLKRLLVLSTIEDAGFLLLGLDSATAPGYSRAILAAVTPTPSPRPFSSPASAALKPPAGCTSRAQQVWPINRQMFPLDTSHRVRSLHCLVTVVTAIDSRPFV